MGHFKWKRESGRALEKRDFLPESGIVDTYSLAQEDNEICAKYEEITKRSGGSDQSDNNFMCA